MYAPTFPYYGMQRQLWHKVDSFDLTRPICHPRTVLSITKARDELPEGVEYCTECKFRAAKRATVPTC